MSQSGVFNLVLRDERFDNLFTASDYLRQRLDKIRDQRKKEGLKNVQPTVDDIKTSHLLYLRAIYKPYVAIASEYVKVKASGDAISGIGNAGGTLQFTFPSYGHFTSDMALHIRFAAVGSTTATTPSNSTPYFRYCAYPGIRMLKKVEFKSQQVVIDDYTPDDVNAYSKFFIREDQRKGWDRCMGQQDQRIASHFGNSYTYNISYNDGPQTPKLYQPEFDIFVPIQLSMCSDAAHALSNDLISNSQRELTCEIANIDDIIQAQIVDPNNPANLLKITLPFNKLSIDATLYVNNLFVNPEIHDIFASRIGFSLIRVHRRQTNSVQNSTDSYLLDQLKFPAEFIMLGFRSRQLALDFDRWHLMGTIPNRSYNNSLWVPAVIWNPTNNVPQLVARIAVDTVTLDNIISSIGVTAHGIDIFPQMPTTFFNSYLPIRYPNNTMVVSPTDTNAFLISFCLYPGKFNPSGYYNLSAGREMYLNYTLNAAAASAFTSNQYEMVLSMSALNFLMRKGDKLTLRYAI